MVSERESTAASILLEHRILTSISSRFLVDAAYAFRDGPELVLALRMMAGGDLAFHLKKSKEGLSADAVRFYLASAMLGLEALHAHGDAPPRHPTPHLLATRLAPRPSPATPPNPPPHLTPTPRPPLPPPPPPPPRPRARA